MTTTARNSLEPRAALPVLDRFRPRGGPVRSSRRSRWRAAALIAVHVAVLVHVAQWKITSSTLTPVEPSEAMETLEVGYVNAGFLLFATLILLTVVLGRFFCGWACHVVAYQDLCAWLLKKIGLKPRPVRSRLLWLVPFFTAFLMFVWPTLHRWWLGQAAPEWSWQLTTSSFWETFPGPGIAALTFLVDGFLIVYWLGAKGFCTYGCPYGAVFGLSDRVAPGRIRVTDACEGCGHCTATCTSNVRVHEEVARFGMVVDQGCMKCMDCVNVCPKGALYYGFGRPSWSARRRTRKGKAADFSWGEEALMAVVLAVGVLVFRGLYAAVSVLLAVGLAVIVAVFAVVAWRLALRRDLTVQSRVLKRDGRLTASGRLAVAGLVSVFALVGHSSVVQYHTAWGEGLAHAGVDPDASPAERRARLAASREHLLAADRWGLVPNRRLPQLLGLVLREQGDFAEAERQLRRALELQPRWVAASIPLTDLLALRGAFDEAEVILRELLADDPTLVPARQRLEMLQRRK